MREPQTLHYRGERKQREKKEKEKKLTVSDKEAAKSKQENKTMPKSRSDLDTAIITSQTKKKQTNKPEYNTGCGQELKAVSISSSNVKLRLLLVQEYTLEPICFLKNTTSV